MYRGTTPTHIFTLPFDAELVKTAQVSYAQFGKVVLQKNMEDCALQEKQIRVELTQEETQMFRSTGWVYIQLKILTTDGKLLASGIEKIHPLDCLSEGALV